MRSAASASSRMSDTLPISETFISLQGEGRLTGVPSWFVRVSGCNLRCGWCDTPYASWNPEGPNRAVKDLVEEAGRSGLRHAVVTGGEPMMFDAVGSLNAALRAAGFHITIETAGTIHRDVACDLMSVSPKLANSTPAEGDARDPLGTWRVRHEARRINTGALQSLIDGYAERQLKFVVCSPADLEEIDALLARVSGWAPGDIQLMPEGTATPEPAAVAWVVDTCLRRGWRFCHRLHVELFGNRRGT